jgi:hypothetical protein
MAANEIGAFIAKIIETLNKNGYPDKKVSLPLEQMYEKAYERGFSFNKVLDFLKEKGIDHQKTTEKIIFFPILDSQTAPLQSAEPAPEQGGGDIPNFDPSSLGGLNMGEMFKKAQEMMSQMSPEQIQNIQKMVTNLTPEQRVEMMKKAKDSGLV